MKVNVADYNTTVEFPDDMPQDKILAVLREKFPPQGGEVDGVPKWGQDNPNLYGAYGAGGALLKTIPYVKYLDPTDREAFSKKDTQHQTRDLLLENLNLVGALATGPIVKGAGPFLKGLSPEAYTALTKSKLYEALTKQRGLTPKVEPPAVVPKPTEPIPAPVPEPVPVATSGGKQPQELTIYRGVGQTKEGYSRPFQHYATDKKEAALYGKVSQEKISYENPFYFENPETDIPKLGISFKEWDLYRNKNGVPAAEDLIFSLAQKQGHDVVFIKPTSSNQYKWVVPVKGKSVPPEIVQPGATSQAKPPLPRGDVMRLEEQKNVIQKIIQEGIVDKERPFVADETQRAMYNIADTITKYPEYGREILTKYNLTPEELSSEILKAGTMHGKGLNEFSQWAKAMKKAFPDDPVIQETLGKVGQLEPVTWWDKIKDVYRAVDDKRRMLMVTQAATAARNALSQGARAGIKVFDDGLQGIMKTAAGIPKQEAFAQFMGDWTAIMGRMTPNKRVGLEAVLNKYPESKAEMLSAPIHDITLGGKISNALMYLNRTQEYFFRKMVFDSRITAWGKKAGVDPYSAEIPDNVLKKAVGDALELTYAAPQNQGFGKAIMDLYKAVPMLTTIHPYPRFWMNAVKFLWDFNPTGYLSAASRARFFSKDPEAVYQAVSRATIGTALLGTGLAFRNSEYAGQKWYEINVGKDRYIDARPFAPLSTYLFLGEAISHPEKLSGRDWAEGALSISRIAGTGLVLVDLLKTESIDSMQKLLKGFAGQYLGGFTVPLRTIKDVAGESTNLNINESPLMGPAVSNVPVLGGKLLNPQPSLTRGGVSEREQTQLRQATGITIKTKTPLETEIDRLNLQKLYPRTGDATLDRLVTEKAGPFINLFGTSVIQRPEYRTADDETRKYMLRETLSKIKEGARKQIAVPYFEGNLTEHSTPAAKHDYLKDLVDKGRIGQPELMTIFTRQPWIFPKEKQQELLKKAYLK